MPPKCSSSSTVRATAPVTSSPRRPPWATQGDRPSADTRPLVHAAIQEVAFYPTVKDALPELADEIDHDLEEHAEAKQLLGDLQGMYPSQEEFDTTFRQLISDIGQHVEEEDSDLFPKVRDALTSRNYATSMRR